MGKFNIPELLHNIEIETKKHVSGPLSGDYKNKLKGSGFEFEQLRDYEPGDDIRYIDWKSSARTSKILVKQYLEDKNRNVYILVDISASTYFGTNGVKSDLIKKIASVLAFASFHNKDSVGLALFTDQIEFVSGAKPSKAHVLFVLEKLFSFVSSAKKTDFTKIIEQFFKSINKRSIICIVSDFAFNIDINLLKALSINHEIIAFRCLDNVEHKFVNAGLLTIQDIETGKKSLINTSDPRLSENLVNWNNNQKNILKAAKIDCFDAVVGKDFFKDLVGFLSQRVHY